MERGEAWSPEMRPTVARMLLLLFWFALGLMGATEAAEVDADSPQWEVRHEFVSLCMHPVLPSFGLAHFGVHPSIQYTLSQSSRKEKPAWLWGGHLLLFVSLF